MATLMDTLNSIKNKKPTVQTGQQEQLQSIARARGGKAVSGVGPQASSVGEQRQIQQGQTANKQQQVGTNIAAGQVEQQANQQQKAFSQQKTAQQQQFEQAMQGLAQKSQLNTEARQADRGIAEQQLASQARMTEEQLSNNYQQALDKISSQLGIDRNSLFKNFERSNKELEDRRDASQLEQLAHMYAMNDKSYLDELNRIGQQRNLEDDINFQREISEIIMGQDLDQALKTADFNVEMANNDADLARELSQMDINTAIAVANAEAKQAAVGSMISGAGQLAKTDYVQNMFDNNTTGQKQ